MVRDIGKRIAELRRDRGLNQEQLAEMAVLNRVTVARYESGKLEPGAQALARIADALDVSVDAILGRSEETEPDKWVISERLRRDPDFLIVFDQIKKAKPEHLKAAAAMLKSLEGEKDD